jgi:hypothetical protein
LVRYTFLARSQFYLFSFEKLIRVSILGFELGGADPFTLMLYR